MNGVSVSYEGRPILQKVHWKIQQGEFWQLVGPNGSGKSTLLSLISGDNPKGYGQELYLFGRKKGSGETVWDIKKNIGYFNSSITLHFNRLDSIEKMIVSGFNDSIGLYVVPSDEQLRLAKEWLHFLGLYDLKNKPIQFLPLAQQRMVLIARAMVKHPPLLILDEPTASLDDAGAALIIEMIQQITKESSSAILYVSHSTEEGLKPDHILELHPGPEGSSISIYENQ
jgi:molybdate transport system ATP-binding protein